MLLPPNPGGGSISLECSDGDCFHETIAPEDIAPDGRVVGSQFLFGGGPLYGPVTWSPEGSGQRALRDALSFAFPSSTTTRKRISASP